MRLPRTLDTMIGRIFMILLVGILLAGTLGVALSEWRRVAEIRHIQGIRAIERIAGFLGELEAVPVARRRHEAREAHSFVRMAGPGDGSGLRAPELTGLLAAQLPRGVGASVNVLPVARCEVITNADADDPDERVRPSPTMRAWRSVVAATDCWRIGVRLSDGSVWSFVTGPPPLLKANYGPDPAFIVVVAAAAALLALLIARIAGAPIRTLTRAAGRVGPEAAAAALPESGPSDVRLAIRAFNDMQARLVEHSAEQTQMIAAITHDLQTPMTRMRLKLEQMEDDATRMRLLSDWNAMRAIVEEGLALARSTDMREEPVLLDIDSLIESIVEDEREAGNVAAFDAAAGRDWICRPQMLRRCVQNLVDNAIKYGGEVNLSTHSEAAGLRIEVRDPGPGIPADQLETVFLPMVRLETSRSRETGGTGLGLTIARNLARRMGAALTLENGSPRGLVCTIRFAAGSHPDGGR